MMVRCVECDKHFECPNGQPKHLCSDICKEKYVQRSLAAVFVFCWKHKRWNVRTVGENMEPCYQCYRERVKAEEANQA